METWQKYLSVVTQMFLQVKERWIHATSLSVMLEGKICFVSIEQCLLFFPLPCLAFHSWWELWLSHVIFNEVHFLSYMELPAPYVPKFGHLSTKEGSSVIGKPLEAPCPLSQYELKWWYWKSVLIILKVVDQASTCLSSVMLLIYSVSMFKQPVF